MTRWLAAGAMVSAAALGACEEKKNPAPVASSVNPAPTTGSTAPAAAGPNAADLYRVCWSKVSSDLNMGAGEVRFTGKGAWMAEGSPGGTWQKVSADLRASQ